MRALYAEGLATGIATFMTAAARWEAWDEGHLTIGRLVARTEDEKVIGWAALAHVPDT